MTKVGYYKCAVVVCLVQDGGKEGERGTVFRYVRPEQRLGTAQILALYIE